MCLICEQHIGLLFLILSMETISKDCENSVKNDSIYSLVLVLHLIITMKLCLNEQNGRLSGSRQVRQKVGLISFVPAMPPTGGRPTTASWDETLRSAQNSARGFNLPVGL